MSAIFNSGGFLLGLHQPCAKRDPEVRGFTYELSRSEVVIDLRGGKVKVIKGKAE